MGDSNRRGVKNQKRADESGYGPELSAVKQATADIQRIKESRNRSLENSSGGAETASTKAQSGAIKLLEAWINQVLDKNAGVANEADKGLSKTVSTSRDVKGELLLKIEGLELGAESTTAVMKALNPVIAKKIDEALAKEAGQPKPSGTT